MRDSEQNDAASDAGWLLHCVRPTVQRRDRFFTEPCNKAPQTQITPSLIVSSWEVRSAP